MITIDDTSEWRQTAACRGMDIELFYPFGAEGSPGYARELERARAVCRFCPVRRECLREAVETGDDHAVRGGSTPGERRSLRVALGMPGVHRPAA